MVLKLSTIFGDWYFHTNTLSDFTYKVAAKNFAVGFVLSRKDYREIVEEEIQSSREFYIKSLYKHHMYREIERFVNSKGNYFDDFLRRKNQIRHKRL